MFGFSLGNYELFSLRSRSLNDVDSMQDVITSPPLLFKKLHLVWDICNLTVLRFIKDQGLKEP